jgi:hypothetical protein
MARFATRKIRFAFRGFGVRRGSMRDRPPDRSNPCAPPDLRSGPVEKLDRKKLRKRAVKSLKSLARVNLCAGCRVGRGRANPRLAAL